jgi:DNA-binding response OmpR family regulator
MAEVLVVEDSPTVLGTIKHLLQGEGHEVHTARDALSAMSALQAFVPDIMLLDIMLPGVGGIELCTMLRRNSRYESMPIIMVTALSNQATLAHYTGADAYVTKPFSDEQLTSTINHHLAVDRGISIGARW